MSNFIPILCIIDPDFYNDIVLICNALNIDYDYENNEFFIEVNSLKIFLINLNEYLKEQWFEEEYKDEIFNNVKIGVFSKFFILYLLGFYFFTSQNLSYFIKTGGNNAYLTINGEFYRAITALTLHNDLAHILSNLFFFLILLKTIIFYLGEGRAWFFIILSGFIGNILSDYIYQFNHISIGFSTSVFGVIGMLILLNENTRKILPIGAALGLFAFTGTGRDVDMVAHFTGMLSGSFLIWLYKNRDFKIFNLGDEFYKIFIVVVVIFCWFLALIK